MKTVLITGANGFIARNLAVRLGHREGVAVRGFGRGDSVEDLRASLADADIVYHLAGVNRPPDVREFQAGNADLTETICRELRGTNRSPQVVFASSVQAELDNPYGNSKRRAEEILEKYGAETGARVSIFRLKNVFGKWSKPNYNTVVATFCHNIARDLPIQISDPNRTVELVHVDDVVDAFINELDHSRERAGAIVADTIPSYSITLGDLAGRIQFFRDMQVTLRVPDFSVRFNQQLYATYLSFVDPPHWEYGLDIKTDTRGNLAEFIKSSSFGQIFVSRTKPGITRGNHYHHTKTEKFLVLHGEGLIRFRHVGGAEIVEHRVRGDDYRVVDIPPGYTHSITNVGAGEMITLFWASEVFDPDRPDTYFVPVDPPAPAVKHGPGDQTAVQSRK